MGGRGQLAGRGAARTALVGVLTSQANTVSTVVTGEAGIGKTSLVDAAVADAVEAGVSVLSGWCLPLSQALPLLPWLEVLRTLADLEQGQVLKDACADCPEFVQGQIDRLLGGAPTASEADADAGWLQYRMFEAVRLVLAATGRQRQLAVTIEDLQWADQLTLDLIEFLQSPGRADRPALVATYRTGESSATPWLLRLTRGGQMRRLPLAPLTLTETADQVELLLREVPDSALVGSIYARTDGNPFFTRQVVAQLRDDPAGAVVSAELIELIRTRTADLDQRQLVIARVLAVAGRALGEHELTRAANCSPHEVRDALTLLERRALLRTLAQSGQHDLAHAVIGEALYAGMQSGVRSDLHVLVASMMADRDQEPLAAEIAHHWRNAGDPRAELPARVRAARYADAVHAATDSAHHWSRALDLARTQAGLPLPDGLRLHDLWARTQDALWWVGRADDAYGLSEEMFAALMPEATTTADQADLYLRLGRGRCISNPGAGLPLLRRAVDLYEQIPPSSGLVGALVEVEGQLRHTGDYESARQVCDRGLALSEVLGLRDPWLRFLGQSAWHAMAAGDDEHAVDLVDRSRAALRPDDSPRRRLVTAVVCSDVLLKVGHLEQTVSVATQGLGECPANMALSFEATLLRANGCEAASEMGSFDPVSGLIDSVTETTPRFDDHLNHSARAGLDMLRGRLVESRARWNEINALAIGSLDFRLEYCRSWLELLLWEGNLDGATTDPLPLLSEAASTDESSICGPILTLALRACADAHEQGRADGDPVVVQRAGERAQALIDLHGRMRLDPLGAGSLTRTGKADRATWAAELTRLDGHSDPAAWAVAVAGWDAKGRPHRAAYARWRQADALLRTRQHHAEVTALLRAAAAQATQHVPLSDAITALARRARVTLTESPEPPAPVTGRFGLTDREHAVLALLAEGRTNSEIGAALFISPKTVSVHVTNLMRKLHVTSRTHAATVATQAGLVTNDHAPG